MFLTPVSMKPYTYGKSTDKALGRCSMARHYVIQDWSNSATWSGEMIGDRLSKSQGHHFLKNGKANTELYAGEEEEPIKRNTSIPLRDRILPQMKRVNTLTDQLIELEQAYKSGQMSIQEYSLLRDVLCQKRDRAEVLYKKAINTAKSRNESAVDSVETDTQNNDQPLPAHREEIVTGTFLDELSCDNFAKYPLQKALQISRVLVRWAIKTKHYINELKRV